VYFLVLLLASIAVHTLHALWTQFRPGDDYAIYEYFAEAVSKGLNPYAIPQNYRSDTVRRFFNNAGVAQPNAGVISQRYADYPPLLMMVNSLVFRLNNVRGLYILYILLYAASIALYLASRISAESESQSSVVNPVIFLIFFALNPLFPQAWFNPTTDKAWFAFFITLVLVFRNMPWLLVISLGLFAGIKGLGVPMMVFYVIYERFEKNIGAKRIGALVVIFAIVVAISHVPWFPDGLRAYQWRLVRQNLVSHDSLFVPLDKVGIFWGGLPQVLTVSAFVLLAWLALKHFLALDEVLLLPIVFSIIFNPELGFDRLLVAIFSMLLLTRNNATIIISYFIGLSLIWSPSRTSSWPIMWGWTLFLLLEILRELLIRNHQRFALPTCSSG